MTNEVVRCGIAAACCALLVLGGCSADRLSRVEDPAISPPTGMPSVPTGAADVRHAGMVDTDNVPGNPPFQSQHGIPGGTALLLKSTVSPPEIAYAVYQTASRPTAPSKITFNVEYLDPTPATFTPEEGYYVGYADYASGHWVFSGLTRLGQMRITIPPTANVISPGNFIYSVVIAESWQAARVVSVEVGYDVGRGYETMMLSPPAGVSVGRMTDIQLDPSESPQIAYLRGPGTSIQLHDQVRIAWVSGTGWSHQDVTTAYPVKNFRFAIGDNGLRALVVSDDDTNDVHLLIDPPDASSDFTIDNVLSANPPGGCMPDVICINGADNPAGDLDTVLAVNIVDSAYPAIQTKFLRWSAGPPASGLVLPGPTRCPGRLCLARRSNKRAVVAVPTAAAYPVWDVEFGEFAALTNTWTFPVVPKWTNVKVDDSSDYQPEALVREEPGATTLVGAYTEDENAALVVARSATGWTFDPHDRVACALDPPVDCETFPDGRFGIVGEYGMYSLVLATGHPGTSGAWNNRYLTTDMATGFGASLAIDSTGTCHIAAADLLDGTLHYFKVTGSTVTDSIADWGGMASSFSTGYAPVVMVGDQLHVFYNDITHFRILHAVNEGGAWTKEGEVVATDGLPYYIEDAGYLEQSQLLYVTYIGAIDYGFRIASGKADGTEWETHRFVPDQQEYCPAADDEVNVGVLCITRAVDEETIGFAVGDPRGGPYAPELVTPNGDLMESPQDLAYDPHGDAWGAIGQNYGRQYCYYYYRQAPGVWAGPSIVDYETGANGRVIGAGLHYLPDGTARVVARAKADASTVYRFNLYSSPTGPPAFGLLTTAKTIDTAAFDILATRTAAGPGGDPLISIMYRQTGIPPWHLSVYGPQSSGTWPFQLDWNTAAQDVAWSEFAFGLASTSTGEAIQTVIDSVPASPLFGRVLVHYPW